MHLWHMSVRHPLSTWTFILVSALLLPLTHKINVLHKVYIQNTTNIMAKRTATSVRPWNAPKRRKTSQKQQVTLAQLPASVRPEVKFSDRNQAGTGTFNTLQARPDTFTTTQGDDGDQMTGSECYLKALDYTIELPSTGWNIARVTVLMPRDPTIAPTGRTPTFRYSHREFVVLYDEVFSINEKNHCRIKQKLNMKQKWSVSGTTITEGNVQVVCNIDAIVGYDCALRTYFTDP